MEEIINKEIDMIDYKRTLNKKQFEAVNVIDGPALVLAGAGTGKTHLLTMRTVRLCEIGVDPENILLITFTNKAAREIKTRVINTLGNLDGGKITAQTFHSFCANILRTYSKSLNLANNFTIIDMDDSKSLIDEIAEELYPQDKSNVSIPKAGQLCAMLSYMRNCNKDLDDAMRIFLQKGKFDRYGIEKVLETFKEYKLEHNYLDYDDLLVFVNDLFENNIQIAKKVADKFKYIMIDEFQDCNNVQLSLIKNMIKGSHENLMVVGDESQSIYGFRGANFMNIINFKKHYPKTKEIILEENYRSQQGILDLANGIVSNMKYKYEKNLISVNNEGYQRPALIKTRTQSEEVFEIMAEIRRLVRLGNSYEDIAILSRTANTQYFEFELLRHNIPYKKYGGMKVFAKAHMKDIIAYLKIISNIEDEIAWKRVLKMQKGIGNKTGDKIIEEIKVNGFDGLLQFDKKKFGPQLATLNKLFKELVESKSVEEILDTLITSYNGTNTGFYYDYLVEAYEKDYEGRLDELNELFPMAYPYTEEDYGESFVTSFIEDIILEGTPEVEAEGVLTLSTVHSAKGLEWKYVFILDCTDTNFPSKLSKTEEEIEEEQRILYVAVTRAKKDLYICVPQSTQLFGRTEWTSVSPFLTKGDLIGKFLD